jgi:hypothetical protein
MREQLGNPPLHQGHRDRLAGPLLFAAGQSPLTTRVAGPVCL